MKVTYQAPSNIAFVKYWGARNLARGEPMNPSISMSLSRCHTRTTVQFQEGETGADEIRFWDEHQGRLIPTSDSFRQRIQAHLDRLREAFGKSGRIRVATWNSFPSAAGLASSASGFAALTLAVLDAMGVEVPAEDLSLWAQRSGSGSAARSVIGGFVEWPGEDGRARQVAPPEHWDLADVIVVVESGEKKVPSLEGHRRAVTSPHFEARLREVPRRLQKIREAIAARSLDDLGPVVEEDAVELHLVAMTSRPPVFYWAPATLAVLRAVRELREAGVRAYFTMDAGANVHVICPGGDAREVARHLGRTQGIVRIIEDRVGRGPEKIQEHWF